MSKTIH